MRPTLLAIVIAVASFSLPIYNQIKASLDTALGTANDVNPHLASEQGDTHHGGTEQGGATHGDAGHGEGGHHIKHTILVTNPVAKDVTLTQQYVCQIHSCRHIEICPLAGGYLDAIHIREGQAVKRGDVLFEILPTLYQAKRDADLAEAQLAQVEYDNTKRLVQQNIVSDQELKLAQAKVAKAEAQVKLAQAELDFTEIRAPFDGIVDRLHEQQGSLIEEGDMLTTLSDNHLMWIYFNVPEARYLEYQTSVEREQDDLQIELMLANGKKFPETGEIAAIEADFDNETGNIAFRADFPNPDGLLRHGQTGNVLINRTLEDAVVIPQRATFEILDKRYVFVVDANGVVHQREIKIRNEMEDIFVIERGLEIRDTIVLDGIRQVRDGEHVEAEFQDPKNVLANLKFHAE